MQLDLHRHDCNNNDCPAARPAGLLTGKIRDKHTRKHTLTLSNRIQRDTGVVGDMPAHRFNPVREETARLGTKRKERKRC